MFKDWIKKKKSERNTNKKLNAPVQHRWLFTLPWKMQTVINQGLRAPDSHFCPNVKIVSRWMRSIVLRNADDTHTFMCRKDNLPSVEDLENELNYCTLHFVSHFLYALEIIGYKHPDKETSKIAFNYYRQFIEDICHFGIESERQMDNRLSDNAEVPSFSDDFGDVIAEELLESKVEEYWEPDRDYSVPSKCPHPDEDNYLKKSLWR